MLKRTLVVSGMLAAGLCFAQGKAKSSGGEKVTYKYGMAGCGLGSLVFKDNTMGSQIGASLVNSPGWIGLFVSALSNTLNYIGSVQTFAISSGTLNCEKPSSAETAALDYIRENEQNLQKDIARGNGDSLNALAKVLGCDSNNLSSGLKSNYSKIYGSAQADVTGLIYENAAQSCQTKI